MKLGHHLPVPLCQSLNFRQCKKAKQVTPAVAKYWKDVTVEMMLDEEKRGEIYVRHQPTYRSDTLNAYIKKLDKCSAEASTFNAKFPRVVGTPTKKAIPPSTKKWIVRQMSASPKATDVDGDETHAREQDGRHSDSDNRSESEVASEEVWLFHSCNQK